MQIPGKSSAFKGGSYPPNANHASATTSSRTEGNEGARPWPRVSGGTTGLGKAQTNIGASADALATALGLSGVYPGTLNLQLDHPFEVPVGAQPVVLPSLGARHQPFYFYPAQLAGQAVWVTRSLSQLEVTDDLLEIVADCSLRARLNLLDGDEVLLTVQADQ